MTPSTYVVQEGFRDWASEQRDGVVVGGTHAFLIVERPSHFSGFRQYFFREAQPILAAERSFHPRLSNDGAVTNWRLSRDNEWSDPRIEWLSESMDDGRYLMFADFSINVVRRTSHGSRWRETESMRQP